MRCRIATGSDMESVYRLTHDVYVCEGYAEMQFDGLLQHYPHLDDIPETIVFVAEDELGNIIGTNSLTFDGPNGLHVDEDFPREVRIIREAARLFGRKLCASWRIVTAVDCRHKLEVILGLICITIEEGSRRSAHEMLFSFNPKHERFYSRTLNLRTIARGQCKATNGADAVLMYTDSRALVRQWQRVCEKRGMEFRCRLADVMWPTDDPRDEEVVV